MNNKYVLISHQRSGTNLLRSFINSSNHFLFVEELFRARGKFESSGQTVNDFLDNSYNNHTIEKAVGFDLKYNQITEDITKYIHDNNLKIIHLIRSPISTAFSDAVHGNDELNKNIFIQHTDYIQEKVNMVRGFENEIFEIRYEDMTRGKEIEKLPRDFEIRLLNFLGIENTDSINLFKSNTRVHVPFLNQNYGKIT